jgi:hypothetical protein
MFNGFIRGKDNLRREFFVPEINETAYYLFFTPGPFFTQKPFARPAPGQQ